MFRKYLLGFLLLGLVALAGVLIYHKLHPKTLPANLIAGVGRIDGDLVNINTKYPGRIAKLMVDEGQSVKKGVLIALLESKEYTAQKDALTAQIAAQQKVLQAKSVALKIEESSLPQNVQKALAAKRAKEAQKRALQSQIATLTAQVAQDDKDLHRLNQLLLRHLIQKHSVELARLKLRADRSKLQAQRQKLQAIDAAIQAADATLAQARSALKKIEARKLQIAALQAQIKALQAKKAQIQAILDELQIRSPLTGYIVDKVALPGEVVGAGMSIVTAIDPSTLYLKIYVDTRKNGRVHIGDRAEIFLDAYPNDPISAKVTHIAQKAEFTPKEVEVRSDRIQRVFGVHIKPLHPDPRLKLGLPAIGIITTNGKDLPTSLQQLPPL